MVDQAELRAVTTSDLGIHLLAVRGLQWICGSPPPGQPDGGDPYSLLLRGQAVEPQEMYRRVRERGALHQSSIETWVTGDHELGAAILTDSRLGVWYAEDSVGEQSPFSLPDPLLSHVLSLDRAFMCMERDEHRRLCDSVGQVVGAAGMRDCRGPVQRACESAIDEAGDEFDLVASVARRVPVDVAAALFGLPDNEYERFEQLCDGVAVALDGALCPPTVRHGSELIASVEQVRDLFIGMIDRRVIDTGGADLISRLLRTGAHANEVLAACTLLTVVGIETAANLISNTILAMLDDPDQWRMLRAQPGLAAAAVEETLRFDPPVRMEHRVAHADMELAGQAIEAGSQLVVLVEAANRDPAVYKDPDRFDITRDHAAGHISLSGGLHTSFVAPLARLQAGIVLRTLAARRPRLRRNGALLHRMRAPVTRSILRLPVAV